MSRRSRLALFLAAGAVLLVALVLATAGLPAFGHYAGRYGHEVMRVEMPARHATDLVTALNFDLRAFDTLGEEFILFASVTGVALLLRAVRGEDQPLQRVRADDKHAFAGASPSLVGLVKLLVPTLIAIGGYLALHGQLTPGGGFQAGIVLAGGPLAVLLSGRYLYLRRLAPGAAWELLDSSGAAAYALIGLGGMLFAGAYLQNYLPLGTPGNLLSAGMMPLNSIAVAVEVTGAFLLVWTEFLDQAIVSSRIETQP